MIWWMTLLVQSALATPATQAQQQCPNNYPALNDACACVNMGKGQWYLAFSQSDINDLNNGHTISTSGSCFDFYTVAGSGYNPSNPPSMTHTIVWNGAQWLAGEYVDDPISAITEDIGLSTDYSLMGAELDGQLDPTDLALAECGPGTYPGDVECSVDGVVQAVLIGGTPTPDMAFTEDFDEDGYTDMLVTFTSTGEVWFLPGPVGPGALYSAPSGPPPGP